MFEPTLESVPLVPTSSVSYFETATGLLVWWLACLILSLTFGRWSDVRLISALLRVSLDKKTFLHIVSSHPGIKVGTGDILLGVTLWWTFHPLHEGVAILPIALCCRNRVKLRPWEPRRLVQAVVRLNFDDKHNIQKCKYTTKIKAKANVKFPNVVFSHGKNHWWLQTHFCLENVEMNVDENRSYK